MQRKKDLLIILSFSVLFALLFYHQPPGLNLVIFEVLIGVCLLARKEIVFSNPLLSVLFIGVYLSLLSTIFTHSVFSYLMNAVLGFLFIGKLCYPQARSLLTSLFLAIDNILHAQGRFLSNLGKVSVGRQKLTYYFRYLAIYLIPLLIISVFVLIYSESSPWFNALAGDVIDRIGSIVANIFENLDMIFISLLVLGLIISNFIFLRKAYARMVEYDKTASDCLSPNPLKNTDYGVQVKNESRAAVFLLLVLNLLILALNVLDIYWVWFNFEWSGELLKQFVHQGTYLLIISILISIGIVLYFFRGEINFTPGNKMLRILSYIWLAQNAILVVSVGIRNFWYIYYFALAYKRIGVVIFLLLALFGLYTVFRKIGEKRSFFYLLRMNALAFLLVLLLSSLINWDRIIARYNFENAGRSFLHLNYMAGLSDQSLPLLDKPLDMLEGLEAAQKERYPYDYAYLSAADYHNSIAERKRRFILRWEDIGILSWNYADYRAYRRLSEGRLEVKSGE